MRLSPTLTDNMDGFESRRNTLLCI